MEVKSFEAVALPADLAMELARIDRVVWPPPAERTNDPLWLFQWPPDDWPLPEAPYPPPMAFVTFDGSGRAVGKAWALPRRVRTERGDETVLALAGVAVLPEFRGGGWGAAMVRRAFGMVDDGRYAWALLQTGVPDFYRKLGATVLDNPIHYRLADDPAARPLLVPYVMVYPADRAPVGTMDILGAPF